MRKYSARWWGGPVFEQWRYRCGLYGDEYVGPFFLFPFRSFDGVPWWGGVPWFGRLYYRDSDGLFLFLCGPKIGDSESTPVAGVGVSV